jgi:hypothetical protein
MGALAFPMRAYLKQLKEHPKKYAYVSISGGAMNDNSGLPDELKRRTGIESVAVIDLHIADLLPPEPKPNTRAIDTYRFTVQDIENLTKRAVTMLREKLPKGVSINERSKEKKKKIKDDGFSIVDCFGDCIHRNRCGYLGCSGEGGTEKYGYRRGEF